MAGSCKSPKSVKVSPYKRANPRKKATARKPAAGAYWRADNGQGQHCSHRHKNASGAAACARREQRAQSKRRARAGQKGRGPLWSFEKVNG